MPGSTLLSLRDVAKTYPSGAGSLTVLSGVTLEVHRGEFLAIVGASGSGKSTLLGLMAGLDRPSAGEVELVGVALHRLSEEELAAVRNQNVGFVFQSFQLIDSFTALENAALPLELRGDRAARSRAERALADVGLAHRLHHTPRQLSGGEQQRVAIARATVTQPLILFADEPTGNLDSTSGEQILSLLDALRRRTELTLILVTHDRAVAARADRVVELRDGRVVSERSPRSSTLQRLSAAAARRR